MSIINGDGGPTYPINPESSRPNQLSAARQPSHNSHTPLPGGGFYLDIGGVPLRTVIKALATHGITVKTKGDHLVAVMTE